MRLFLSKPTCLEGLHAFSSRLNKNDISSILSEYANESDQFISAIVGQLIKDGINLNINENAPEDILKLLEAVNWAAKTIDSAYYDFKPKLVEYAAQRLDDAKSGQYGWGKDEYTDDVFYLFHPGVGTVSVHDPHNEIAISKDFKWDFGWSGVFRQDRAFDAVKGDEQVINELAESTTPEEWSEESYRRAEQSFWNINIKSGNIVGSLEIRSLS